MSIITENNDRTPEVVELPNGTREWRLDGRRHRPAERLAEAARLLLTANTSDFEDCDVCAVLVEVECPYHQGRRDEHNDAEKPAEPIVWDGTDETRHRLHLALGDRWYVDVVGWVRDLHLTSRADAEMDTPVAVGWRIRIEGDSFAILPPGGDAMTHVDMTAMGDSVKMLRETFCVAQQAIGEDQRDRWKEHINRLSRLIAICDANREVTL